MMKKHDRFTRNEQVEDKFISLNALRDIIRLYKDSASEQS